MSPLSPVALVEDATDLGRFFFCVSLRRADSGAGISFRALIFVPSELPTDFWGKAEKGIKGIVRLMVKRVFITGESRRVFRPSFCTD